MTPTEVLEFIPIIFAIIAIIFASMKVNTIRRKTDLVVCVLSIIGPILMIVAQTSWFVTAVVENNLIGTWFANKTWTIFNTLMMVIIIIVNTPRFKNEKNNS